MKTSTSFLYGVTIGPEFWDQYGWFIINFAEESARNALTQNSGALKIKIELEVTVTYLENRHYSEQGDMQDDYFEEDHDEDTEEAHEPKDMANVAAPNIMQLETYAYEKSDKVNNICVICFEEYICEERVTKTKCQHVFHERCPQEWFQRKRNCPACRSRGSIEGHVTSITNATSNSPSKDESMFKNRKTILEIKDINDEQEQKDEEHDTAFSILDNMIGTRWIFQIKIKRSSTNESYSSYTLGRVFPINEELEMSFNLPLFNKRRDDLSQTTISTNAKQIDEIGSEEAAKYKHKKRKLKKLIYDDDNEQEQKSA
ncbi:hypothetical protein GIB67_021354 [Kingdonia uniflora]|uniref:RING-type domain-containing protein n=1 Tax=Kingdonia uniflora TaxID=39325 RepID=A0A7J7MD47_9MAGN|nr:hypothetical protein GIB67_021354 [Kingdonia uniflora]